MKLCLSMWSLQEEIEAGRMDFDSFLSFCRLNAVENVELLDFFVHCGVPEIKRKLGDSGIRADVWSVVNDFVQENPEGMEQQIDYVKKGIDIAAEIGAKVVRIFSGDSKDGISYEKGKAWIIEALFNCEPYARKSGITMALENHGLFAGTSGQIRDILKAVDSQWLRCTFDTANFLFVDEDPLAAAENLMEYTGLVHFKDYRLAGKDEEGYPSLGGIPYIGTPLGQGAVPLKGIAEKLASSGYDGSISIEFEGPEPVAGVESSIRYTRKLLGGVEE